MINPKLTADGGEGRVEIGGEVLEGFEAHRKAQQAIANVELGARLRTDAVMRRGGRVRDQRLGVTEIVGNLDQAEGVLQREGAGLAALHLEGDHLSAAGHLPLGDVRLRVVGAAAMQHAR